MAVRFLLCGYSFHTRSFSSAYKSGLPMYLVRLQSEGSSTVFVNGRRSKMRRGDLLLLRPGDVYALSIGERREQDNSSEIPSGDYHLICESNWVREWWARSPKPQLSQIPIEERLINLWRLLIVEKRRLPAGQGDDEMLDYLLRSLCLTLERSIAESSGSGGQPGAVIRMLRFIEEHATDCLSVEEIARHAELSPSHAAHLFKSSLGTSIMGYVREIKLAAAMEQMRYTSLSLEKIAESSGFGSYPHFHKVFRRKYGVSPGAFRRGE